jgi:aryl-alcohol dehydrogenase-like predicted oxidoreductase
MGISRRHFLHCSALAAGAGLLGGTSLQNKKVDAGSGAEEIRIKEYRILGRTGYRVSDLAAGATVDGSLLAALLDAGINYIDTSESYGPSESVIGEVLKNRNRDSIFVSDKVQMDTGLRPRPPSDLTKEGVLKRVYQSLERMKTDYLDCLMVSNAETVETLKSDAFHAAAEQLKKEGRVKFLGVSHHGSQWWFKKPRESMEMVLTAAAEDGRFDVVLMAYNFLRQDESEKLLEICRKKNIGIALMKSNPTRSYFSMKQWLDQRLEKGETVTEVQRKNLTQMKEKVDQAALFMEKHGLETPSQIRDASIRFVLSNPDVSTVCISVANFNEKDEFLRLSGGRLSDKDRALLSAYEKDCGDLYCRHACGVCEPSCPHHVPVNTILRYHHYFAAQHREKFGMTKYAALSGRQGNLCGGCSAPCEKVCPYGVPIQGLLLHAHDTLTL